MQPNDTQPSRALGAGLIAFGALLSALAAAGALAAADHMAVAANLCGPVAGHCILCVVSAASVLASAGVIAAGVALLTPPPTQAAESGVRSSI